VVGPSSELDPLQAGVFNVLGGCYVPSHEAALTVWYVSTLLSLVMSVCCVLGYVIQAGSSGLIGAVPALPLRGSQLT
jgi:hypothetical protein